MSNALNPVVVEQDFPVSRGTLWRAITERDQMIQWFFAEIPEFKPESGFETEFNIHSGERDFHHMWKILEVIPEQKIVYDWRYPDFPGVGKVIFELFEQKDGSRLRVTNEGLETFPQDVPEFARESCEAGWKYFIQGNLRDYLAGRQ